MESSPFFIFFEKTNAQAHQRQCDDGRFRHVSHIVEQAQIERTAGIDGLVPLHSPGNMAGAAAGCAVQIVTVDGGERGPGLAVGFDLEKRRGRYSSKVVRAHPKVAEGLGRCAYSAERSFLNVLVRGVAPIAQGKIRIKEQM